jgi:hypothetical protein
MKLHRLALVLVSSSILVTVGCGSSTTSGGTGGKAGTGGASGTGGTTGTGGRLGSGGTTGTGGVIGTGGGIGAGGEGTVSGGTTGAGGGAEGGGNGVAGRGAGGRPGNMGGRGGRAAGGRGGVAGGAAGGANGTGGGGGAVAANAMMNVFVTSDTSATGNLGGIVMADARCQRLAAAVGQGSKTWHAYLSTDTPVTNAIDRIGEGPYFNSRGAMLAADKASLHTRTGDYMVFLTELGGFVSGQWPGSPNGVQHDILTGSLANGMLMANTTCMNWTSAAAGLMSQVGHSDGLGPVGTPPTPALMSWNSSHMGFCNDTVQRGGLGRLYCFVAP